MMYGHKVLFLIFTLTIVLLIGCSKVGEVTPAFANRPNILVIVLDDLGIHRSGYIW